MKVRIDTLSQQHIGRTGRITITMIPSTIEINKLELIGDTGWLQSSYGSEDFVFYILARHRLYIKYNNDSKILWCVKETRDCKKAAWFSHNHKFFDKISETKSCSVSIEEALEMAEAYTRWPRDPFEITDTCDMFRKTKDKLKDF
jgi:hypothetical protein